MFFVFVLRAYEDSVEAVEAVKEIDCDLFLYADVAHLVLVSVEQEVVAEEMVMGILHQVGDGSG
jgi:hypothetical protein